VVVDDSRVSREGLVELLNADPDVEVVGTASNGQEAIGAVSRVRPDVITMDIHMPVMNGYEATRRIMETLPTPIVIVSGSSAPLEVAKTFRALEAGALSVVEKPAGPGHPDRESTAHEVLRAVKLMSEVKVVRQWRRPQGGTFQPATQMTKAPAELATQAVEAVALGASTGGPQALQTLLKALRSDFAIPMLVVQHMAPSFIHGFAEWLSETTGFRARVARQGEAILPGNIYLAPDRVHMGVRPGERIILIRDERADGPCPSVAYLFRSMAAVYGSRSAGVLLTGMGKDGAQELKQMRQAGALTIAQDEASSVIYGMPGEAFKLGAATCVLSPESIAAALNALNHKLE
jgi:two-component system chemotaxis response regulator CheB